MLGLRRGTSDSLITMIATPTVWALHFLFCYIWVATACAPNENIFESILPARIGVAVATVLGLAFCFFAGLRAWREWREQGGEPPHDKPTEGERERLMEFASFMLSSLSFVAIVFTALPALLIADCR